MKIYIDFDGTLFDTDRYTKDFMNIFSQYDIDNFMFDQVKRELFNDENLFNLDIIIDYFIKKYNVDIKIKKDMENLLNNSYLYSEVKDCLDELISSGFELYLLTYGNKQFQDIKIKSSKIDKYFKEIIITDKDKSELKLDYRNSIFIDNNPAVIESLYNTKPKVLIRIKRDGDRYANIKCNILDIIEYKDFNQVVQYLKGGIYNE